jgi:hypothetical protein
LLGAGVKLATSSLLTPAGSGSFPGELALKAARALAPRLPPDGRRSRMVTFSTTASTDTTISEVLHKAAETSSSLPVAQDQHVHKLPAVSEPSGASRGRGFCFWVCCAPSPTVSMGQ